LGFFTGSTLEATMETPEQGTDGTRIFVRGFRPITDATTIYGYVRYRETVGALPTTGTEVLIKSRTGRCDLRRSARYQRLGVRIPAATNWTYCAGVEPDVTTEGLV
jgi:hypothetical protein